MRRPAPLLLLAVALMQAATAGSIVAAEWEPRSTPVLIAAALSVLAGTALAYSSFSPLVSHGFAAVYGAFVVAAIGGSQPQVAALGEWRARVFFLGEALTRWARAVAAGEITRETVVFMVVLSALLWGLGYSATWQALRYQRAWHAILPLGAMLLSNAYYYAGARSLAPFLGVFLFGALLLLSASHLATRAAHWPSLLRGLPASLSGWMLLASLSAAAVSALFGWRLSATPLISDREEVLRPLRETYERITQRLSMLQTSGRSTVAVQPLEQHADSLTLSGARTLSSAIVMEVNAPPARYYWRATSYDSYDGRTWRNTASTLLRAEAALRLPEYAARERVRAVLTLFRSSDTLFTPAQPLGASIRAQRLIEVLDEAQAAIVQLRAESLLSPGVRYEAEGSLSRASVSELRRASTQYPDWVVERYLQVPPQVPDRVRDLAANITRGSETPFDKATALERWLRENIAYDEALPEPPPDTEASDYLLFHARRGYCTYYATAMVMMLRGLGVPARLAVGYAQGMPLLGRASEHSVTYRVTERDSHAWVEVFFPEYGWVEFEPTAAQPPIPRMEDVVATLPEAEPTPTPEPTPTSAPLIAAQSATLPTPTALPPPAPHSVSPVSRSTPSSALLAALLLALVSGSVVLARRGWSWMETVGLEALPPVMRAYGVLLRYASWLGLYCPHYTPYEQAEALALEFPALAPLLRELTEHYVRYRFEAHHLAPADADRWLPVMLPVLRQALRQRWSARLLGHGALVALKTLGRRHRPQP